MALLRLVRHEEVPVASGGGEGKRTQPVAGRWAGSTAGRQLLMRAGGSAGGVKHATHVLVTRHKADDGRHRPNPYSMRARGPRWYWRKAKKFAAGLLRQIGAGSFQGNRTGGEKAGHPASRRPRIGPKIGEFAAAAQMLPPRKPRAIGRKTNRGREVPCAPLPPRRTLSCYPSR